MEIASCITRNASTSSCVKLPGPHKPCPVSGGYGMRVLPVVLSTLLPMMAAMPMAMLGRPAATVPSRGSARCWVLANRQDCRPERIKACACCRRWRPRARPPGPAHSHGTWRQALADGRCMSCRTGRTRGNGGAPVAGDGGHALGDPGPAGRHSAQRQVLAQLRRADGDRVLHLQQLLAQLRALVRDVAHAPAPGLLIRHLPAQGTHIGSNVQQSAAVFTAARPALRPATQCSLARTPAPSLILSTRLPTSTQLMMRNVQQAGPSAAARPAPRPGTRCFSHLPALSLHSECLPANLDMLQAVCSEREAHTLLAHAQLHAHAHLDRRLILQKACCLAHTLVN